MGRVNLSRFPPVASLIDSPTKCIPSSVKSCTSAIDTSSRYKLAGEPSLAPVGWRIDCIGRCVVVLTKIHDADVNVRSNAFPFWRDLLPKSGNDALARWRFPVRQLPNWISATDGKWFDHDLSNFNRSAAENCTRNHRGPSMHGKRWINYRFNFFKKMKTVVCSARFFTQTRTNLSTKSLTTATALRSLLCRHKLFSWMKRPSGIRNNTFQS